MCLQRGIYADHKRGCTETIQVQPVDLASLNSYAFHVLEEEKVTHIMEVLRAGGRQVVSLGSLHQATV